MCNAEETMSMEIIIIGDELISGKTRDLNGWYASGCLLSRGLLTSEIRTVGDNYPSIASALRAAVKKSQVVIVTGGLGPTEDDRTTEAVSRVFRRPLVLDRDLLAHIKESIARLGLSWSPSLEKLAWLPKGSRILDPNRQMCDLHRSILKTAMAMAAEIRQHDEETYFRMIDNAM